MASSPEGYSTVLALVGRWWATFMGNTAELRFSIRLHPIGSHPAGPEFRAGYVAPFDRRFSVVAEPSKHRRLYGVSASRYVSLKSRLPMPNHRATICAIGSDEESSTVPHHQGATASD